MNSRDIIEYKKELAEWEDLFKRTSVLLSDKPDDAYWNEQRRRLEINRKILLETLNKLYT